MESKQQLLELVSRYKKEKSSYLRDLLKFVPEAVVKAASYKKVEKNQFILCAGMPCDMVYIILSGRIVGVDLQKTGQAYCFMDFIHMDIVGDLEVFAGMPEYTVSIKTVEECELLAIPSSCYLRWIQHDENASFLRLKNITATLTSEKKSEREIFFMNCRERLIVYLVQSYENKRQEHTGIYKLTRTQKELSERVGFNYRSVQRCIAELEKENLISIEGGRITISEEQYIQLKGR